MAEPEQDVERDMIDSISSDLVGRTDPEVRTQLIRVRSKASSQTFIHEQLNEEGKIIGYTAKRLPTAYREPLTEDVSTSHLTLLQFSVWMGHFRLAEMIKGYGQANGLDMTDSHNKVVDYMNGLATGTKGVEGRGAQAAMSNFINTHYETYKKEQEEQKKKKRFLGIF